MSSHAFAAPSPFSVNPFTTASSNPFAPSTPPPAEAAEASFAIVASGPPVLAAEVETYADAIEVTVRWGSQVLAVRHLGAAERFVAGEGGLALPEEALGAASLALVTPRPGGGAMLSVPRTASGWLQKGFDLRALAAGEELLLEDGAKATVTIPSSNATSPLTFEIASVRAGRAVPASFMDALAKSAGGFVLASFLGHAAIVASLAFFVPRMGADDAEAIDRDQILLMQKLLNARAEAEAEDKPQPTDADAAEAGGGSTGARHHGEEGAAGTTKHVTTDGHMAFKGTDQDSAVARKMELALAAEGGLVGMLMASNQDPNAPSSPWSTDTYRGSDERSAMGKMWGASIDDATGFGLGLSGTGLGGGGDANGVGIDGIAGLGGGGNGPGKWGIGKGDGDGIGNGHSPLQGGHRVKQITMRTADVSTNGRLPAEAIQRVVRMNFGRFRLCYENALQANPSLTGRIATRFVIDRTGAVATAQDAGSDLPDQKVVSCVVSGFHNLSFPAPEGGIATVTYPIVFSPGS